MIRCAKTLVGSPPCCCMLFCCFFPSKKKKKSEPLATRRAKKTHPKKSVKLRSAGGHGGSCGPLVDPANGCAGGPGCSRTGGEKWDTWEETGPIDRYFCGTVVNELLDSFILFYVFFPGLLVGFMWVFLKKQVDKHPNF